MLWGMKCYPVELATVSKRHPDGGTFADHGLDGETFWMGVANSPDGETFADHDLANSLNGETFYDACGEEEGGGHPPPLAHDFRQTGFTSTGKHFLCVRGTRLGDGLDGGTYPAPENVPPSRPCACAALDLRRTRRGNIFRAGKCFRVEPVASRALRGPDGGTFLNFWVFRSGTVPPSGTHFVFDPWKCFPVGVAL